MIHLSFERVVFYSRSNLRNITDFLMMRKATEKIDGNPLHSHDEKENCVVK